MGPLHFLAFNGLEVPCSQEVVITLHELDNINSDSYSIRIPCTLGEVSADFKFSGYKVHAEPRDRSYESSDVAYDIVEVVATLEPQIRMKSSTEKNAEYRLEGEVIAATAEAYNPSRFSEFT